MSTTGPIPGRSEGVGGCVIRFMDHSRQTYRRHDDSDSAILVSGPSLTRKARPIAHRHDLLGWPITTVVSLIGHRIQLQLVPVPSAGDGWPAARTVQGPSVRESGSERHQIRPITVGTETKQITSRALRAFDAMADTVCHGTYQCNQNRFAGRPSRTLDETRHEPFGTSPFKPLESSPAADTENSWAQRGR